MIESVSPRGVRLVRCGSVAEALRRFETEQLAAQDGQRLVACLWKKLPLVSGIVDETLDRLAEAAKAVWPEWYGAGGDESTETKLPDEAVVRDIVVSWRRAAEARCRAGMLPRVPGYAPAMEAAQLARAVAATKLLVVLAVLGPEAEPDRLLGLARAAEWLAESTSAAVAVLVPDTLAECRELDSISFGAIELCEPVPPVAGASDEKEDFLVVPFRGRPHPNSRGEQILAARLESDPELAGLFCFNEPVLADSGSRYLVDLLWTAGRVVVEVDGYYWHSARDSFSDDRRRDFDLITSGYLPLRLPHDEVLADVEAAVAKIRTLVAFRRRHPYVTGGM